MVDLLFAISEHFFASSYRWDVISWYWSKSAFFKGGGSLKAQISGGRGHRPPTSFDIRKLDWLPQKSIKGESKSSPLGLFDDFSNGLEFWDKILHIYSTFPCKIKFDWLQQLRCFSVFCMTSSDFRMFKNVCTEASYNYNVKMLSTGTRLLPMTLWVT